MRTEATGRGLVHLACHGLADQAHGNLFGALALTPGKDPLEPSDDGFLNLTEIYSLDLRGCELAILSACDTNVGVVRAGQGVASLQKALHIAGARSAVTALWEVPDEVTRMLMSDFYRRLWTQKKSKIRALWEAKKNIRDRRDARGRHRYRFRDWAGWVLTGEDG